MSNDSDPSGPLQQGPGIPHRPPPGSDRVPESVGDALRFLVRETRATAAAYLRFVRRPKDTSFRHVTLASLDRVAYGLVGVAVALARVGRRRRSARPSSRED